MAAQDPGRENSIGFVGLGDMGGPIAHRIAAAGFPRPSGPAVLTH